MPSLYALDNRLRTKLGRQKPTPGYCIFIDVVDSVALKDKGLSAWCDAMYNVISPSRSWLEGIDQDAETGHGDPGSSLLEPHGLPPLKVIGDCIMFFVPKRSMAPGADALTIFNSLLNIIRVPKQAGRGVLPEVRVAITSCQEAQQVTFVKGTEDIHGKEIDLAARLVKHGDPQELVMDESFYTEAKCVYLNWRAAGNRAGPEDGYEQFAHVQGPWTKSLRGFKEPVHIFKWRGPRLRPRPSKRVQPSAAT